jgi:hypothetical protein
MQQRDRPQPLSQPQLGSQPHEASQPQLPPRMPPSRPNVAFASLALVSTNAAPRASVDKT